MRQLLFLIAMLLLFCQTAFAGVLGTNLVEKKPDSCPTAVKITQVRWAFHIDGATGMSKLRLIFDLSGPVEADGVISGNPSPQLVISLNNTVPGNGVESQQLDSRVADKLQIDLVAESTTQLTIWLPLMLDDSDYKLGTLPADPIGGKPFRLVVDINKLLPLTTFNFTPGLKNKVIVLDPGHGGSDPGAVGLGGTTEKSVNLPVALKVKALLEAVGAKVIMTRGTDRDVFGPDDSAVEELNARAMIANSHKADLYLSIHANAAYNRGVGGTGTYYFQKTRYDSILAQNIQACVVQQVGLVDRGCFPANFYVLKHTIMPAALLEMAFLSNPDEEKILINDDFQQKVAQGIVQGLDQFFTQVSAPGGGR